MAGGQDVDGEAAFPLKDGIPVSLENRFLAVAPSLKMGPRRRGGRRPAPPWTEAPLPWHNPDDPSGREK